jgi:hypothetical protein
MSRWITLRWRAPLVAQLVRVLERVEQLAADQRDQRRRHAQAGAGAFVGDAAQVDALDQWHHPVRSPVVHADVDRRHQAAVLEPRRQPRLVEEHRDVRALLGQVRQQALDRDHAAKARIDLGGGDGAEQLGHASDGDPIQQGVPAELLDPRHRRHGAHPSDAIQGTQQESEKIFAPGSGREWPSAPRRREGHSSMRRWPGPHAGCACGPLTAAAERDSQASRAQRT